MIIQNLFSGLGIRICVWLFLEHTNENMNNINAKGGLVANTITPNLVYINIKIPFVSPVRRGMKQSGSMNGSLREDIACHKPNAGIKLIMKCYFAYSLPDFWEGDQQIHKPNFSSQNSELLHGKFIKTTVVIPPIKSKASLVDYISLRTNQLHLLRPPNTDQIHKQTAPQPWATQKLTHRWSPKIIVPTQSPSISIKNIEQPIRDIPVQAQARPRTDEFEWEFQPPTLANIEALLLSAIRRSHWGFWRVLQSIAPKWRNHQLQSAARIMRWIAQEIGRIDTKDMNTDK